MSAQCQQTRANGRFGLLQARCLGQVRSQTRTIVAVAPYPRQTVHRMLTNTNSSEASSPNLRSSRSAGSTPLWLQALRVTNRTQPGGMSRMLRLLDLQKRAQPLGSRSTA